jgi:hypothetical protein
MNASPGAQEHAKLTRFCQQESDYCREKSAIPIYVSLFDIRTKPFGKPSIIMIHQARARRVRQLGHSKGKGLCDGGRTTRGTFGAKVGASPVCSRSWTIKLCAMYGIELEDHHRALCDARAAARLLNLINKKRDEVVSTEAEQAA